MHPARSTPWLVALTLVGVFAGGTQPHILHILLDDFGWADAGWHRPPGYKDLQTPNMDALVKEGVELDRHYVFKFCSPSRSAVQSGRNPIHVNVLNLAPTYRNEEDLVSGYAAVPRNMTGIAEHMLRAGYETHMYGKWDAGMATPQHTPHGRGYQKSLSYFHHDNDYWTNTVGVCKSGEADGRRTSIVDLWDTNKPAHGQNNTPSCSQARQDGCVYEDRLFANRVLAAIEERDAKKPLFIFWSPHIVHTPLQVPQAELDRFSFIDEASRRYYHAMVYFVDEAIGQVTQKLKDEGIWDNTVIALHADNGGPIYHSGVAGANNYPLKGGKMSNWDGGIRVNAFVSGGFLPQSVRGTKQEGLMAGWDWYATWAALAGVDPTDMRAAAASLPPIDSHNLWPLISGQTENSPRQELAIGDLGTPNLEGVAETLVGGIIQGRYKVLIGELGQAGWSGPKFPNSTSHWDPSESFQACGRTPETGCLYDIVQDPGEHVSLAKQKPELFKRMLASIAEMQKGVFSPDRGRVDPAACHHALRNYGGFWGPFVDVDAKEVENLSTSWREEVVV